VTIKPILVSFLTFIANMGIVILCSNLIGPSSAFAVADDIRGAQTFYTTESEIYTAVRPNTLNHDAVYNEVIPAVLKFLELPIEFDLMISAPGRTLRSDSGKSCGLRIEKTSRRTMVFLLDPDIESPDRSEIARFEIGWRILAMAKASALWDSSVSLESDGVRFDHLTRTAGFGTSWNIEKYSLELKKVGGAELQITIGNIDSQTNLIKCSFSGPLVPYSLQPIE